jgi:hypothetical protein
MNVSTTDHEQRTTNDTIITNNTNTRREINKPTNQIRKRNTNTITMLPPTAEDACRLSESTLTPPRQIMQVEDATRCTTALSVTAEDACRLSESTLTPPRQIMQVTVVTCCSTSPSVTAEDAIAG